MTDNNESFLQRIVLLNATAIAPQGWRHGFKLIVAAVLAICLWGFWIWLALSHFLAVQEIARQIAEAPQDRAKIEQIEKAVAVINDTAKTLYVLVIPLATAVTGYFFATSASPPLLNSRSLIESQSEASAEEGNIASSDRPPTLTPPLIPTMPSERGESRDRLTSTTANSPPE